RNWSVRLYVSLRAIQHATPPPTQRRRHRQRYPRPPIPLATAARHARPGTRRQAPRPRREPVLISFGGQTGPASIAPVVYQVPRAAFVEAAPPPTSIECCAVRSSTWHDRRHGTKSPPETRIRGPPRRRAR